MVGVNYFWGFDLGMKNDASALSIAHLEFGGSTGIRLVYDYIDRMMVGEKFEGRASSMPRRKQIRRIFRPATHRHPRVAKSYESYDAMLPRSN